MSLELSQNKFKLIIRILRWNEMSFKILIFVGGVKMVCKIYLFDVILFNICERQDEKELKILDNIGFVIA